MAIPFFILHRFRHPYMSRIPVFAAFGLLSATLLLTGCEKKSTTLFRLVDPKSSGIDFTNTIYDDDKFNIITQQYIYNGGGVAVGDFNNDGLQDIFFSGNMVPNRLYLNKGDLEFRDVTEKAGVSGTNKWKSGVALADINNDGWLDMYVCSTMSEDSTLRANQMLINQGLSDDGVPTFVDKAKEYGIEFKGYTSNAAFLDYDYDGDLDLFILTNTRQANLPARYMPKVNDGSSTNTDRLYRNNGDGTFTDAGKEAGILAEGYGLGVAIADVDKDGLDDIYVSNDYITNDLLYLNKGKGKFANEIDKGIKHQSKFSMGNDIGDINNDGLPDIVTVDMLPETNLRKKTVIVGVNYTVYVNDVQFGYTHQHVRNMLQLNNGNGTFSEIGQMAGIYQTEWSWAPLFADFDNDGYKDLFVTNGFPKDITDRDFISFRGKVSTVTDNATLMSEVPSVKVANYAFKNNGDLTFTNKSQEWGINQPLFSNGAAFADLDNDGDLDYIVNNVNDVSSVYENTLYKGGDEKEKSTHFLRLKPVGEKGNLSGLGVKATLHYDHGKIQYLEHQIYRGYVSTVEDMMHFGLGSIAKVDTLFIEWPDGKVQLMKDVATDQVIKIDHKDAVDRGTVDIAAKKVTPFVKDVAAEKGVAFKPAEEDKIDFNVQRTIPHKFSQSGPGIAVGDVDGNGLDDFYVGGAADNHGVLFTQEKSGAFKSKNLVGGIPKKEEDEGALFFDADNDGDLDLYVVSGSIEYEPGSLFYNDRLYKNNGKGLFTLDEHALPKTGAAGMCVRASDFDKDGDLDLFVGGRVPPGSYPFADESYLLKNDKGVFTNVTAEYCKDLVKPGMVMDALWTDFDNDGTTDLIVVGEFMAVQFYKNTGKSFEKIPSGIDQYKGWFTSITGGDFDNDGDTDYVVGNLGLNNYYNCSETQPLQVFGKDFDNNGSVDPVISCYVLDVDGKMKPYPVHFWDDMNSQSPKFRRKFAKYKDFALLTTDKFFSPEDLKGAVVLDANFLASSYIENSGNGKFSIRKLPTLSQTAPVNGMVPYDIDDDGNLDLLLVGNDYANEPTGGQYDALTGLILKGDGKGNFVEIPSYKSGFFVNGDAKGLARLTGSNGDIFVATQNRDSVKVFSPVTGARRPVFKPGALDRSANLTMKDGKKQKVEFYYGSGYLSQSSRGISISPSVTTIEVTIADGTVKTIDVKDLR